MKSMQGIASAMALPHEHPPSRFPSFPALERTAVMGFNAPFPYGVGSVRQPAILMRQPTFPLWLGREPTNVLYGVTYPVKTGQGQTCEIQAGIDYWFTDNITAKGPASYTFTVSGGVSHPDVPWPLLGIDAGTGHSGPQEWIYVPANCFVTVVHSNNVSYSADPLMNLDYDVWCSPGEFITQTTSSAFTRTLNQTSTTISFGSVAQWFRPKSFRSSAATEAAASAGTVAIIVHTGVATITGAATGSGWTCAIVPAAVRCMLPATYPAEFINSPLPWSATRLTAVSALFTNTTKIQNKEGTVTAGRLNPQLVNVWVKSSDTSVLTNLHPAEKAFMGLESGHYTYCPPSTDLGMFYDYTVNTTALSTKDSNNSAITSVSVPIIRLDNDSMVNMMIFFDPDGSTNLAVNLDWHIEFRSSSSLWQLGLSTLTIEAMHQAQLALVAAGFFYSNATHVTTIASILKTIAKWAVAAYPYAQRIIEPRTNALLLDSTPGKRTTPPSTSAKASGWDGPETTRKALPSTRMSRPSRQPPRRPRTRTKSGTRTQPRRAASAVKRPERGPRGLRGGLDIYLARQAQTK